MTASLSFDVLGEPKPQGSGKLIRAKGTGRQFIKQDAKFAQWRNQVAEAAARAKPPGWEPLDVPTRLVVTFRFLRPKSQTKAQKAIPWKANGSDLDKLVRAIGDALTVAQVVTDDRVVANLSAWKRYVGEGDDGPGCYVLVEAI